MDVKQIGSQINAALYEQAMSWLELSQLSGVNYRTLLNIKNQKVLYVRSTTLDKISKVLGVDFK